MSNSATSVMVFSPPTFRQDDSFLSVNSRTSSDRVFVLRLICAEIKLICSFNWIFNFTSLYQNDFFKVSYVCMVCIHTCCSSIRNHFPDGNNIHNFAQKQKN